MDARHLKAATSAMPLNNLAWLRPGIALPLIINGLRGRECWIPVPFAPPATPETHLKLPPIVDMKTVRLDSDLIDNNNWRKLDSTDLSYKIIRFLASLTASLALSAAIPSGIGGETRIDSSSDSGSQRQHAEGQPRQGNSCLLEGQDGHCVGGVRRTSLLYQIVCSQAILLFGVFCFSITRAFPPGERPDCRWIAGIAAGV